MKFPNLALVCLTLVPSGLLFAQSISTRPTEFVRLTVEATSQSEYKSIVLSLEEGDVAWVRGDPMESGLYQEPSLAASLEGSQQWMPLRAGDVFVGPGSIQLVAASSIYDDDDGVAVATLEILRKSTSQGIVTDFSGNLVIPQDAGGPVQIILEQSSDMITWTAANPGGRFFRLRGVILPGQ